MSTSNIQPGAPVGLAAQQFLIQQKINSFASDVHRLEGQLRSARTIMDVVRASGSLPSAPSLISWSPEVKRSRRSADLALTNAAKAVVDAELKQLDECFAGMPDAQFQRRLGEFQRDLRYLGTFASNVMRDAWQHAWQNYRFKKEIHQSGQYQIHALTATDPRNQITQGDASPGVVLCMTSILYEQGGTVAATRDASGAMITVGFHHGRDSYTFCDERRPLSQKYDFGTLQECISIFERELQVTLPAIKVIWPGYGVWEAHQKYTSDVAGNPWHLHVGQHYDVTASNGKTRRYLVNEDETITDINDSTNLRAHPKEWWGTAEWLSLRKVEQTDKLTQRERG